MTIWTIEQRMAAFRTSRSLSDVFRAVWLGWLAHEDKQRSRRRLADLNDDQLRDIGLTRADVNREMAKVLL